MKKEEDKNLDETNRCLYKRNETKKTINGNSKSIV